MTKKDIIRTVSNDLGIDQKLAQTAVQAVLDAVLEKTALSGRAELRNFGVFEVKRRAARKARNPQSSARITPKPQSSPMSG